MGLPETGVRLVAENERGFLSALNKSTAAVKTFQGGTEKASIGTIALGSAVGNLITGGLSVVARTATQAGQALFGFVSGGIQDAAALEAQMSGIAAVTGASATEMEALETLILDLGLDPNLTVSTVEAAQAIEMLGKNGVSVTDIIDGMALSTVQLANSTGADFATAADLATDTMALFRNEGIEMGNAVNGITGVVNASKFGINDYALALANGGGAAAALGVEFSDFNAMLTAISPSFTSGATAGTAMKNMLLRLTPATNKAEDEMMALGLITEDGSNAFFDAEGNMKSMSEVGLLLSNSLSGLSEQQKATTLKTIFGNDAMEAVLATMSAGTPLYTDAATAAAELGLSFEDAARFIEAGGNQIALASIQMESVDAGASAATRVDNFAGAMDILSGVVEGVKIQIGDKFLPVLTELAQKVGDFIANNSQGFIDFFSQAADFVGIFFENLLQGEGPMGSFMAALTALVPQETHEKITVVVNAIGDFIAKVVEFVTEHKDTFIGAIKGIGSALTAAAIVTTIAGIVAAIGTILSPMGLIIATAALLGAAWENNWGGIQEKTQAVIDFIGPLITEAMTAIQTFWAENGASILATATEVWEGIKTAVNLAMVFIRDNVIVPIGTAIAAFWTEHGEAIKKNAKLVWDFIKKTIKTRLENVKLIFEAFKAAFEGDWTTFGSKLREVWDNNWELIKEFFNTWGRDFLIKVSTFITDIIAKFGKTDWKQVGIDIIQGMINGIMAMREAFINGLVGIISAGADAARGFLGIESPSKLFMEMGKNTGAGMALGIASEAGAVSAAAGGLSQAAAAGAIRPPASAGQIMTRNNTTTTNNQTVNFTGNFANNPQITDRDMLIRTMATI